MDGGAAIAWTEIGAVLTLRAGYNAAVVVAGTALLGAAAGTVGTFMLLRRRALVGDALSHATLPGIALAFLAATALGGEGRNLPVLLAGAVVSGALGVLTIQAIGRYTRLPEDAAIGSVLSVFFGLGIVLLSYIQSLETGGQAGLKTFILGQTAAMSAGEAMAIGLLALAAALVVAALFKEFRLICFDPDFASGQGWPVGRIDRVLLGLVVLVTVIGLQTVGLILAVALLIVPAAAARFWTERLPAMTLSAAVIGALSGWLGASLSALFARLPAGAIIVLVAGAFFVLSFLFAPARGLVTAAVRATRLRIAVAERTALRRLLEDEPDGRAPAGRVLGWWLLARGLVQPGSTRLTARGRAAALAAERNVRLWQRFLARYPGQIPPDAAWGLDPIDRILPRDMVAELERQA